MRWEWSTCDAIRWRVMALDRGGGLSAAGQRKAHLITAGLPVPGACAPFTQLPYVSRLVRTAARATPAGKFGNP